MLPSHRFLLSLSHLFKAINCSNTDVVALATKSPLSSVVNFSTVVTYVCDLGYEISSGDASRTCQANGSLSGTLPACTCMLAPLRLF